MFDSLKTQNQDTTAKSRSLPQWLINQKNQTVIEKEPVIIKKDYSLVKSLSFTGIAIVLIVIIISFFILRKKEK